MSGLEFRQLSRAWCTLLVDYKFKPTEVLLLLILKEETWDREQVEGRIALDRWARRLRGDGRGDKLREEVWDELVKLDVIDANYGQGTYRLRPDPGSWKSIRGWRRFKASTADNLRAGPELDLIAPRPLSEALSELAVQQTLKAETVKSVPGAQSEPGGAPALPGSQAAATKNNPAAPGTNAPDWGWLRSQIEQQEDGATVAEKSARERKRALADKSATMGASLLADKSAIPQSAGNARDSSMADKSATSGTSPPIASLALSCTKLKLAKPMADLSAEAWAWLESIDVNGDLRRRGWVREQWAALVERNPGYVLRKLRGAYEYHTERAQQGEDLEPIEIPLAWIAAKARAELQLRNVRK